MEERTSVITNLQEFSKAKGVRVTFLAGDVHCGAIGKLFNASAPESQDNFLMYQIVSSAIGNVPPPNALLKNVNGSAKTMKAGPVDTKEEMVEHFLQGVDGKPSNTKKLMGRRNYCLIQAPFGDLGSPSPLEFCLQVEDTLHTNPSKPYPLSVPPMHAPLA